MRLTALTIVNYRSITKAHKLQFDAKTVLIGPNNEGKSNILRALVTALKVLERSGTRAYEPGKGKKANLPSFFYRRLYDWEADFPIHLQTKTPSGKSSFLLEFALNESEILLFKARLGFKLSGKIGLRIELGRASGTLSVSIRGPAAEKLTNKVGQVAHFIAQRIRIRYIPAVRTERAAHEVVDAILGQELEPIEDDPRYKKALATIESLQRPVLEAISKRLKTTMSEFLPAVKDVSVKIAASAASAALRASSEIFINDGETTHLKYKGDGVQSLVALALMRNPPESDEHRFHTIVAVEEPESHLHPSAIHALRAVLEDIGLRQQLVLTTHCPLFVDRTSIAANILVKDSKAESAKSIDQIRQILGVRASDNLRHAQLVLLVEGEDDCILLRSLLPHLSGKLSAALSSGALALDKLGGATNLSFKASLITNSLCECHCYLDNDDAGHRGFERARLDGILKDADVNFVICPGMDESEFEDLLDRPAYEQVIANKFHVLLDNPKFRTSKKWSDRLKDTFLVHGKQWNDRVEAEVKLLVAETCAQKPLTALNVHKRGSIDGLVTALEMRLPK